MFKKLLLTLSWLVFAATVSAKLRLQRLHNLLPFKN
jgi:hypothetical protein